MFPAGDGKQPLCWPCCVQAWFWSMRCKTWSECDLDKRAPLQYFLCFHCLARPVGRLKIFWRDLHYPLLPLSRSLALPPLGVVQSHDNLKSALSLPLVIQMDRCRRYSGARILFEVFGSCEVKPHFREHLPEHLRARRTGECRKEARLSEGQRNKMRFHSLCPDMAKTHIF